MNDASLQAASDLLYEHWVRGSVISGLPVGIGPATREEGYAIQARLEKRSRSPVYGWKIAATSTAGQAHIGVDGPMAGRILAERVVPCAGVIPAGPNHMAVAEIEFAFRMGRGAWFISANFVGNPGIVSGNRNSVTVIGGRWYLEGTDGTRQDGNLLRGTVTWPASLDVSIGCGPGVAMLSATLSHNGFKPAGEISGCIDDTHLDQVYPPKVWGRFEIN